MEFKVPRMMQIEHEELHQELARASRSGGKTGAAAGDVARLLRPHFLREEEFALPPLALLPALASGRITPEMREAVAMADRLKKDLGRMVSEHRAVVASLRVLADAALEENRPEYIRFARKLTLHAQAEEEVFYPATILIGEYLNLKLGAGG